MIVGAAAVNAVMNVNGGTLQAYGYTFVQMLSNLIGVCFFRIVWMWVIYPLNKTPFNFLICYPVTWSITAVTLFIVVVIMTKKYLRGEKDFNI
jgi:Na+-driven multidrug efflux pump